MSSLAALRNHSFIIPLAMVPLFTAFLLIYHVKGENGIPLASKSTDLSACVSGIIKTHYIKEITYVDINSDEDILQGIKDNVTVSILSRKAHIRFILYNENYLIQVGSVTDFMEEFESLTKEAAWEPLAQFLIVFNKIEGDLKVVFDELLKFHVLNVVIVDATEDINLYTYNPFENYACGKYYERIIHYGKCSESNNRNLFPEKLVTGIRNCTFNVDSLNWPPYAVNTHLKFGTLGIEQYLFKVLTSLEDFKVNYTYTDNAEFFSTVDDNMTVSGPLSSLQENAVDIAIGGMVLTEERAAAFDILWSHIPFIDEIVILVKKARRVYTWQYIFLEFPLLIWLLLVLTLILYAIFVALVVEVQDKGLLVLKMYGALLFHGMSVKNTSGSFVLMCWVVFAFLMGSHYISILTSLTTHPLDGFQISTEKDLTTYNLKACISPIMRMVLPEVNKLSANHQNLSQGCDSLYESMQTVSQTEEAYTVSFSAVYFFYKHQFCDENSCRMYMFPQPINKILYAMYLYKGFPMLKRLHKQTVRVREAGLIATAMNIIYLERDMHNTVSIREFKNFVLIPWHALICGWILSAVAFLVEIRLGRQKRRIY